MHRKTLTKPRYWLAKFNKWVFERRFPDAPWLSESAVYLLDIWLRPTEALNGARDGVRFGLLRGSRI